MANFSLRGGHVVLKVQLCSVAVLALLVATSCGGDSSPTSPSTPTPPATRILNLSSDVAFGNVLVGETASGTLRISNDGTAPLTVTAVAGPSGLTANWTSGQIQPGATQTVTLGFTPSSPGMFSGTMTVTGNQTQGSNTRLVTAAVYASMKGAWSGTNAVSGGGQSKVCNMTWVVTGQTAGNFSGTWQTGGVSCGQAGTVTGVISTSNAISDLAISATVSPSPCSLLSGAARETGLLSGSRATTQLIQVIRCPGAADLARSSTTSMTKQ